LLVVDVSYLLAKVNLLCGNRWDYANDGYLDALKHLTDLKEEGKREGLYLSPLL